MKIPIEALELVRFASTGEGRTTLEWMRLRSSKGTQQMEATTTDGHMLAQVTWTPDDLEGLQNFEVPKFLDTDEIRVHLKRVPKRDRILGADLRYTPDGNYSLQLEGLEPQPIRMSTNPEFPDQGNIDSLIPPGEIHEGKLSGVQFGMNLQLTQTVYDWVKATNGNPMMKFTGSDKLSPFRMDSDLHMNLPNATAVFVLMPCRI